MFPGKPTEDVKAELAQQDWISKEFDNTHEIVHKLIISGVVLITADLS